MDPLTLMAIASIIGAGTGVAGLMKRQPTAPTYAPSANVGDKPMIPVNNPYQNNNPYQGQDPYGQMQNPMMRRPPMFSSTLGRYGGLG